MKRTIILCFAWLLASTTGFFASAAASPAAGPARPLRVLFVGNSYTSVNHLPVIFKEIATSAGCPAPEVEAVTPGGKTLEWHLKDAKSLEKIDAGGWDVVVLQEQSQRPAMAEESDSQRTGFLNGVVGLYDRVKARSPAARVVLYETWARHPDYWFGAKVEAGLGLDAAGMQARLRKWYRHAVEVHIPKHSEAPRKTDAILAPAGDAWELNYKDAHPLRLHAKDNSHPDFNGSYLAGLVIFGAVYQPASLAVGYHGKLGNEEAVRLQRIATQALAGVKHIAR